MERLTGAWRPLLLAVLVASVVACGPSGSQLMSDARTNVQKRAYEDARIQLKGVLQASPDSGEARFLLGKVMAATGDPAGAEAEFRRALEASHPQEVVLPDLAAVLVALGKGPLLVQQYANVRLADPLASAELKTQLAAGHLQGGGEAEAETLLREALQLVPGHVPAQLLEARLLATRNNLDGALARVTDIVKRAPDNVAAIALEGDLLMARGKRDEAAAAWRRALALQPDLAVVHSALMNALISGNNIAGAEAQLEAMRKALPKHPETTFFEAVLASNRGDHARASELTQLLLRGAPNNARVLILAGEAELKLNNLAQAETLLAKALQVTPRVALPRLMLAQVQIRANSPDKALSTLAPLLDAKPPNAEALAMAGQAHLMTGNTKLAEATFERAAKANPDNPRLRAIRALTKLGQGNDTAAFGELESIAANDKGNRVDLALVNARLRNGDVSGAKKAIDLMGVKAPKSALPDHLRARIAILQGDKPGARASYEKALAKDADYLPSLSGLAELDLAERQFDAARTRFEASLARRPDNASAMLALADIAARSGKHPEANDWIEKAVKAAPTALMPLLVQVDHLLAQQQPKKALEAAQDGVTKHPNSAELRERMGRAELASGQALQAAGSFTKLVALQPKSANALLLLAEAQAAANNLSGAAATVRRAQELAPDALPVLQAVALQAMRDKKPDQALALVRKMQTVAPKDPLGYKLDGDLALGQQRWDAAATAYRKAVEVAGTAAGDLPTRLHTALSRSSQPAEADRFATEWQKSHPDDPVFQIHLGDLAMARKSLDVAEQHYRKVLARYPDSLLALNNLAFVLGSQGKAGGMALAQRAVDLSPNQPAFLDTLALCQAAESELPKAVENQTKAVALAPNAPNFRLQLARLQLKSGDKRSARNELRRLADLGDKYPRQAEVSELLKQVGG